MMHTRIFLIGFMGSGKTTSGKKIARMMGYDFIDMDEWIVAKTGSSVSEIFEKQGEVAFRKLETEAIQELSKKEKVVIATGGGAPCHFENMALMKEAGLSIYLKLSPEALYSRLTQSRNIRPLVEKKKGEELLNYIKETLAIRELHYSQAAMIIDGLERVTERVVNAIQRR